MLNNKEILQKRKVRKIDKNNWYEFGLPRNKKILDENIDKECLYIHNLTRKKRYVLNQMYNILVVIY